MCLWVIGAGQFASAAEQNVAERITIDGLVPAAPLPEGFSVRKQDIKNGEVIGGHLLIVTKEGVRTAGIVQIEKRDFTKRAARVAAFKGYFNSTIESWRQRGFTVTGKAVPDMDNLDFSKPVIVVMNAAKEGESSVAIYMKVFFTQYAYAVMCTSGDPASGKTMITWCGTVEPISQGTASQPAQ